jgi:hypothetical protein
MSSVTAAGSPGYDIPDVRVWVLFRVGTLYLVEFSEIFQTSVYSLHLMSNHYVVTERFGH